MQLEPETSLTTRLRSPGAHLDTTTTPVVDSLAPRRRSGERDRERGFTKPPPVQGNVPLSPALSPLVLSGEREWGASDMVVVSRCAPVPRFILSSIAYVRP